MSVVKRVFFILILFIISLATPIESRSDVELSAHYRSARNGEAIDYVWGGQIRRNWLEIGVDWMPFESTAALYGAAVYRLFQNSWFQPHVALGLGYYYAPSFVPSLGFHMQWGSLAFRMDILTYISVYSLNTQRHQLYGISYTF